MNNSLVETALENCPDEKSDTFWAMLLDLLFSDQKEENEYALSFFNNSIIRKSLPKAVACIEAYTYYRASGGHIWQETYDFIFNRLKELLHDEDRNQNLLTQSILNFLSLSERPEDTIHCIKMLKKISPECTNLPYLLYTIISLGTRFSDPLIAEKCIKILHETKQSNKFTSANDELISIIHNYLPTLFSKKITKPQKHTGKYTISLALSGGGFRAALFHAGVLSALNKFTEEFSETVTLNNIYAVSGGSIIASYYCLGNDPEEFVSFFKNENRNILQKLKNLFNIAKLNRSKAVGDTIKSTFFKGINKNFTDLKDTPTLNIIAYDYEKADALVFSKNSMHKEKLFDIFTAISASCAFPVILNPVKITGIQILDYRNKYNDTNIDENTIIVNGGEKILYDGGLIDNTALFPIYKNNNRDTIVICSDCGSPVYDETKKSMKVFSRFLSTSIKNVANFLKNEIATQYGPCFFLIEADNHLTRIHTFSLPDQNQANDLYLAGRQKGEELVTKLNILIN